MLACLFGPEGEARGCAKDLGVDPGVLRYLRSHQECFEIVGQPWSGFRLEAGRCHVAPLERTERGRPYAELITWRLEVDRLERDLATRSYARSASRAEQQGGPLQWRVEPPQVDETMVASVRHSYLTALQAQIDREQPGPVRAWLLRESRDIAGAIDASRKMKTP